MPAFAIDSFPPQLRAVTCSVVAADGQKITKAVRSRLQLKVTTGSGAEVLCREEMDKDRLLFKISVQGEERYEVVAMLACLHLPGSPLIIPPHSGVETVASELGFLLRDSKELEKIWGVPESRETRVKVEGEAHSKVQKLSRSKQVSRKAVSEGKCQSQHDPGQEVVASTHKLRRPASPLERTTGCTDGQSQLRCASPSRRAEPGCVFDQDTAGNLKLKSGSKEQTKPVEVGQHLKTRIEKTDKKLEVDGSCYMLGDDTNMWHAGCVHKIISKDLIVVKNLDNQTYNGCSRNQVVLNIEDIPHGANCADSAKKTTKEKMKESMVSDNPPRFLPGDNCVARWSEDQVWYRAEIITTSPTITVQFIDYGNETEVRDCDIVSAGWEVPAQDVNAGLVDAGVAFESEEESRGGLDDKKTWSAGETCLARWEMDGVWYRVKVVEATSAGSTKVLFVDYGNQDDVTALVRTAAELCEGDVKDPFVEDVEGFHSTQIYEEPNTEESACQPRLADVDLTELACCVCGNVKKVAKLHFNIKCPLLKELCRQCTGFSAIGPLSAGTVL